MLSRALRLATVTLLFGCLTAAAVQAAENLEAGKTPSQIFSGTCNACHKSPRGLLKNVPASSLPGFLRQHYTTSSDMASVLASFLVSNGAADTRYQGKQGHDAAKEAAKQEARPAAGAQPEQLDRSGRRVRPAASDAQQAARPDADGLTPQADPGRQGRNAKRAPDAGEAPAQAAIDPGPDGRKPGGKQKLGKKGRPGTEEPPKTPDVAKDEPSKDESKGDTAKVDDAKPSGDAKPEAAKGDVPKETGSGETPALRADPVPAVTPAPTLATPAPAPSAAVSSGAPESSSAPLPSSPPPPPAPEPAVAASGPPVAPAGPPVPPISQ